MIFGKFFPFIIVLNWVITIHRFLIFSHTEDHTMFIFRLYMIHTAAGSDSKLWFPDSLEMVECKQYKIIISDG